MDINGPEVKRPRHHYDAPQRMPSHAQPPPNSLPPSSHPPPGILTGPPHFSHPPPSPFHDGGHDGRNLPDPINPHNYVQQHPPSGHTTPRDGRFQSEVDFSRRGSASGLPRSPSNDHPHLSNHRPTNIVTTSDGQQFPAQQYPVDQGPMAGYPPSEAHMNGNMPSHGLPMHAHDQPGPPMNPAYPEGYAQSPIGPPPYPLYGPPMGQQASRIPKKGNRATQVSNRVPWYLDLSG